jgi:hypothetical protein
MMISLMLAHWAGDFLLQSGWMAVEKSRSLRALSAHVLTYSAVLLGFSLWLAPVVTALEFVLLNMALHFLIDAATSRLAGRFRQRENQWGFFSTIGFDQWLHFVCLYLTAQAMLTG